jgi:hypothetical protein
MVETEPSSEEHSILEKEYRAGSAAVFSDTTHSGAEPVTAARSKSILPPLTKLKVPPDANEVLPPKGNETSVADEFSTRLVMIIFAAVGAGLM